MSSPSFRANRDLIFSKFYLPGRGFNTFELFNEPLEVESFEESVLFVAVFFFTFLPFFVFCFALSFERVFLDRLDGFIAQKQRPSGVQAVNAIHHKRIV